MELSRMRGLMSYFTKILFGKAGPYTLYYMGCGIYQKVNSFFNRTGAREEDRLIGRWGLCYSVWRWDVLEMFIAQPALSCTPA